MVYRLYWILKDKHKLKTRGKFKKKEWMDVENMDSETAYI